MTSATLRRPPVRWIGLAGIFALHLALVLIFLSSRPPAQPESRDAPAMIWLRFRPMEPPLPPPVDPMPQLPAMPVTPPTPRPPASVVAQQPAPPAPAALPAEPVITETTPALPSADEIRQQARRDIGKIDKDLRNNTFQGKLIRAPVSTPQTRLAKGFDEAAALVPNKWYEKPKVEELLDPGGSGRRIYKVTGAGGTYCITVESNHALDGIDSMQKGIHQKTTDCGPNPPPSATTQAY